ncbi:MAG: transcriptional regulator [Proteobacteria bacterium]|nr:transcriptional regulator [Pseudomonadota bacterium]
MKKFRTDDDFDLFPAENSSLAEYSAAQPGDELVEKFICKIQTYELAKSRCKNLPDPIEEIKRVMRRKGLTNNDLKPCIGSSGNVCDILMRRRSLSLRMIRNLHNFLGIPAEILIQPY